MSIWYYLFLIILLVFMIGMMFFQTRKAKQQQEERKNFWSNLAPGTEIVTIGGLIGKVVEVDEQYEEIVLDSEGTLLRFTFRAMMRKRYSIGMGGLLERGNGVSRWPYGRFSLE